MKIEKRKDGWTVRLPDSYGNLIDFATHATEDSASAHLAHIEEVAGLSGAIVFDWHSAKKCLYVWHTAMMRLGFSARNAQAKGFFSTVRLTSRQPTLLDAAYFLAVNRSTWVEYKSIGQLIADERKFCPAEAGRIEAEILAYRPLSKGFLTGQMSLLDTVV